MIKIELGSSFEVIYGIDSQFTGVTGGFDLRQGALFEAPDEIVVDDIWDTAHSSPTRRSYRDLWTAISKFPAHGQGARIYMSMDALSNALGRLDRAGAFFVKLQDPDQVKAAIAEIERSLPGYTVRDLLDFATLMNR